MDMQTLEIINKICEGTTVLGGLTFLGCFFNSLINDECFKSLKPTIIAGGATVASVFGLAYSTQKLQDAKYKEIPATCLKITEGVENHRSYGVAPMTGISSSGNVVMGQTTTAYGSSVPYRYYYFDTDNNPKTTEYIGKVKNTPQNTVKLENEGAQIGKKMPLYQWQQLGLQLSRVD